MKSLALLILASLLFSKDYCIQPVCEYNNRDLQLCPSPLTSIVNIILIFPSLSNYMILLHLFQSSSKKIFKFCWKPLNLDCLALTKVDPLLMQNFCYNFLLLDIEYFFLENYAWPRITICTKVRLGRRSLHAAAANLDY